MESKGRGAVVDVDVDVDVDVGEGGGVGGGRPTVAKAIIELRLAWVSSSFGGGVQEEGTTVRGGREEGC